MNPTIRPSESLLSVCSFQPLNKQSTVPHCESSHLLAYLRNDSMRSMKSISSRELNDGRCNSLKAISSERPSGNEAWLIDLIGSEPCTLRPLSNLGSNLVPKPTPNAMGSKFRTAPTRRRPPPLRLEQEGNTLGKENFLIGSKASPACSVKVHEFKPPSPWLILNKFPTPPSSPAVIPGSRTSTGLSKMLHRGGNTPDVPVSIPGTLKLGHKEYGGMQDENGLPTAPCLSKKKRNASFGSLGKFRTIPNTPIPTSTPWIRIQPDSLNDRVGDDTKRLNNSHRRDNFKSKLFSITASAGSNIQGGGDQRLPIVPNARPISRREICGASDSAERLAMAHGSTKSGKSRSQSESQPAQRAKVDNKADPTPGRSEVQWTNHTPIDMENQLIIPERRTHSPSYINLYVPPWRQVTLSPTKTAFASVGMMSAPTTPVNAAFDLIDEVMHLPASRSTRSLRAELDPFGAGEPDSFFRSEYGRNWNASVKVDQDVIDFYKTIGAGVGALKSLKPRGPRSGQQAIIYNEVPEIVVSSSDGVKGMKDSS